MKQFLIVCFWLSSIVFSACQINHYNKLHYDKIVLLPSDAKAPIPKNHTLKYKTSIDIVNSHLTGVLLAKQTADSSLRVVFVNEFGMKYFDLEFLKEKTITHYVFEPLNKKQVLNSFDKNLRNMFLFNLYFSHSGKYTQNDQSIVYGVFNSTQKNFITVNENKEIITQITFHKRKVKSKTTYFYSSDLNTYSHIYCKQYGLISFKFDLTLIPKNNED
jgi:hypothetical protein